MTHADKPKRKIDFKVLFISRASLLYDTSNPVIIYRFRIGQDRVVFGPVQFLKTTIERAKFGCPLLKNLAIEALKSISDAHLIF